MNDTWTINDAVALRGYIFANPKFLRILTSRRPAIEGHTIEERAVTGSEANGFMIALEEIEALQALREEAEQSPGFIEDPEP